MQRRNLIGHAWLGICLTVLTVGAAAEAPPLRTGVVTLDIKPQLIGTALNEFAQQSGLQALFYSDVVNGLMAPAVIGTFTTDEALLKLLSNTRLTYSKVNERTVAIHEQLPASAIPAAGKQVDRKFLHLTAAQMAEARRSSDGGATESEDQQVPAANARESDDYKRKRGVLEEVIVTAQKREERLIDVPQSVTVLSSDALANLGAVQFRDFANTVPGLTFMTAGAGFNQISLRGVTTGLDVTSTVAIYVDEVPYGTSGAFANGSILGLDVGLFDLQRIEVLRGPQGTLYGASTMGGLIKYVSNQPDAASFGVDVQTGISDTRDGGVSYNGAAVVNAPIVTDKAAVRASGFYSRDSGHIDNLALGEKDVNRSEIYGGRTDLLLTPTDALTIRITGFLQEVSRNGWATADYTFAGAPEDGSLDQRRMFAEPFDQRFRLISGTATYDLEWAALTSISSYQTVRTANSWDFSRLLVPIFGSIGLPFSAVGQQSKVSTDRFVQEVRLAAQRTEPIEWLIGGFYTHETSGNEQELVLRDPEGQPVPNNLFTVSFPSRYEEYAAFGNLTWHLTDKFDVSGGTRYAGNRQKFTQFGSGLLIGSTPARRSSEDVFTYLANARYHFSDHATGYLRYATGYRPGGPNFVANDPTTGLPVAPETFEADRLKSYEAGFKAETADRRFGFDLAGYYIDWSNIQISAIRGGFGVWANAPGGASVRGGELTFTARPTSGSTVMGAFAYQDATLSEADPDLGGAKGERLPGVPRFTAALTADYDLPVRSLQPTIGATLRYVSDRRAGFDNSTSIPQFRLPDYTTVDLRAGLTLDRVNVQLYVHNLFDERGQLSAFTTLGTARAAILQPRTIGVTAKTHF